MGVFVIAIDSMKLESNTDNDITNYFEKIFAATGKIISENEVTLIFVDEKNKYTDMSLILDIINRYDMIKYINGYSRDIINVFTRVEVNKTDGKNKERYLEPVDVLEKSAIMDLMADGYLPLIFAPGVPVIKDLQYYTSVDGIIDGNLYSSLLASLLEADTFMIITNTDLTAINFGNSAINKIKKISYRELYEKYMKGYFKNADLNGVIKSVINFISRGGREAVIIRDVGFEFRIEIVP